MAKSRSPVETIKLRIIGVRPLLMHKAEQFLDPFDPMRLEMKRLTDKKTKKTEDDIRRMFELEWTMSLYADENEAIYLPAENIERAIRDGAAIARKGKDLQAGAFVPDHAPLVNPKNGQQYKGLDDLYAADDGKRHSFRAVVANQKNRVLRTRPIFRDWQADFTVQFMPSVINREDILEAIEKAGILKGIGDYRPRYGTFRVEEVA